MSRPHISDIILEWKSPVLNIRMIWEYPDESGDFSGIKILETCLFRKEGTLVRGWTSHMAYYLPQPQLIK